MPSLQSSLGLGLGLLVGALAIAACTGDDPTPASPSATTDAGSTPPAPPPGPGDSGSPDAALACPKDTADCDGDPSNGCETSLLSPDTCGACGHACGGTAACQKGQCSSETVGTGLNHPYGFAVTGGRALWMSPDAVWGCSVATCSTSTAIMVDISTTSNIPSPGTSSPRQIAVVGNNFYYEKCPAGASNTDCAPAECPITGCKNLGSTILKSSSGYRHAQILVGGPDAVYTYYGIDGLQKFSVPAPSTNSSGGYGVGDYFGGAWVDAQHFIWISDDASLANPTGGLYVCPVAGCTNPPTLLAPAVRLLTVGGNIAFTTTGGASNLPNASVLACAITGCGGAGAAIAQGQAYISDIMADDKDVIWSTVGAASATSNTAPVGTVLRCSLPSCAGGPVKLAEGVVNPVGVQLDSNYFYWITYGTGANKDGTLVRRRR